MSSQSVISTQTKLRTQSEKADNIYSLRVTEPSQTSWDLIMEHIEQPIEDPPATEQEEEGSAEAPEGEGTVSSEPPQSEVIRHEDPQDISKTKQTVLKVPASLPQSINLEKFGRFGPRIRLIIGPLEEILSIPEVISPTKSTETRPAPPFPPIRSGYWMYYAQPQQRPMEVV